MRVDVDDELRHGTTRFVVSGRHDPYTVRFTDLHKWIVELSNFAGDPTKSNESKLEAIQSAWHEEWEDRTRS